MTYLLLSISLYISYCNLWTYKFNSCETLKCISIFIFYKYKKRFIMSLKGYPPFDIKQIFGGVPQILILILPKIYKGSSTLMLLKHNVNNYIKIRWLIYFMKLYLHYACMSHCGHLERQIIISVFVHVTYYKVQKWIIFNGIRFQWIIISVFVHVKSILAEQTVNLKSYISMTYNYSHNLETHTRNVISIAKSILITCIS